MPSIIEQLQLKKEVVFTITITPALTRAVKVRYITRDDTAIAADGDYIALDGILTFAIGETTRLVRVPVIQPDEGELQFYLDISWVSKPFSDTITCVGTIHA